MEQRCDGEAVRPHRTRPKSKPVWCETHAEQFDRVARELGYVKLPRFAGTPEELTDAIVAYVLAAPEPIKRKDLAGHFGHGASSPVLAAAARAGIDDGRIVAVQWGSSFLYGRPGASRPKPTRTRKEGAASLATLLRSEGPLSRAQIMERLGVGDSSVSNYAAEGREHGWIAPAHGGGHPYEAGDVAPPVAA